MTVLTGEQPAKPVKGLTFEDVWAALMELRNSQQETDKQMKKTDRQMKETGRQIKELKKNMDESQKRIEKNLGGIGNSLGDLTESMFSGELWKKFNELKIPVHKQSARMKFGKDDKIIAEVDIYIENGECVVLIEIKTTLTTGDVDKHIKRIEIIRDYFNEHGDKRKLLGAVAGGIFSEETRGYVYDQGLFLLVQSGDLVTITDLPEGFNARKW
jgi:hypothetical protein